MRIRHQKRQVLCIVRKNINTPISHLWNDRIPFMDQKREIQYSMIHKTVPLFPQRTNKILMGTNEYKIQKVVEGYWKIRL